MIDVLIYESKDGYTGFQMKGHAEYADYGQDIVCAGASALAINTINSLESFTDDDCETKVDSDSGSLVLLVRSRPISDSASLLLRSLVLGLRGIEKQYGKKHIHIHFKKIGGR